MHASESEGHTHALHECLMPEHPGRALIPRIGAAVALPVVFGHDGRARAILAEDGRRDAHRLSGGVEAVGELDAVELRMRVHAVDPAVNRDDGHDAAALGWECVDFLRERVQPVFIGDDDERAHLIVRSPLENGCLQSREELVRFEREARGHDCKRARFVCGDCELLV